jgi:hypothetical protein
MLPTFDHLLETAANIERMIPKFDWESMIPNLNLGLLEAASIYENILPSSTLEMMAAADWEPTVLPLPTPVTLMEQLEPLVREVKDTNKLARRSNVLAEQSNDRAGQIVVLTVLLLVFAILAFLGR